MSDGNDPKPPPPPPPEPPEKTKERLKKAFAPPTPAELEKQARAKAKGGLSPRGVRQFEEQRARVAEAAGISEAEAEEAIVDVQRERLGIVKPTTRAVQRATPIITTREEIVRATPPKINVQTRLAQLSAQKQFATPLGVQRIEAEERLLRRTEQVEEPEVFLPEAKPTFEALPTSDIVEAERIQNIALADIGQITPSIITGPQLPIFQPSLQVTPPPRDIIERARRLAKRLEFRADLDTTITGPIGPRAAATVLFLGSGLVSPFLRPAETIGAFATPPSEIIAGLRQASTSELIGTGAAIALVPNVVRGTALGITKAVPIARRFIRATGEVTGEALGSKRAEFGKQRTILREVPKKEKFVEFEVEFEPLPQARQIALERARARIKTKEVTIEFEKLPEARRIALERLRRSKQPVGFIEKGTGRSGFLIPILSDDETDVTTIPLSTPVTLTKPVITQKTLLEKAIAQKGRQRVEPATAVSVKPATAVKVSQRPAQTTQQKAAQKTATRQLTKPVQVTKTARVTGFTATGVPIFVVPPILLPGVETKKRKKKIPIQEDPGQAYAGLVKRKQIKKGKGSFISRGFSRVNKQPLTRKAALGMAMAAADKYTNRSVRLKKIAGKPKQRKDLELRASRLRQKFRQSKKNINIFVEKSKFAIDSRQEKLGIPFEAARLRRKGLIKSKRKRRS